MRLLSVWMMRTMENLKVREGCGFVMVKKKDWAKLLIYGGESVKR